MKSDNFLTGQERKAVQESTDQLKSAFPVNQVVLFGSKARGDADDESDLDLLVLTSREISWAERKKIHEVIFKIELAYDVVISLMIVPEYDWYEGHFSVMPIYAEVSKDGFLI